MNMKNDASLLFDGELHLYEHQASVNPNLPLRDLSYVTRQLERYTKDRPLYGRRLVKIPEPRFVAFYNGTEEQPEQRELKLSDSFLKKTDQPELELKVQMININYGKNRELMKRSRSLEGYSILVDRIRNYAKEMPMAEAVDRAVSECIREGILSEFLSAQRAEVKAVSIFEYDEEKERRLLQESSWEDGREAGMEAGLEAGKEIGKEIGLKAGMEAGKEIGLKAGIETGKSSGKAEFLLKVLSRLGEVDEALKARILSQEDPECLDRWFEAAMDSGSVEEFLRKAG